MIQGCAPGPGSGNFCYSGFVPGKAVPVPGLKKFRPFRNSAQQDIYVKTINFYLQKLQIFSTSLRSASKMPFLLFLGRFLLEFEKIWCIFSLKVTKFVSVPGFSFFRFCSGSVFRTLSLFRYIPSLNLFYGCITDIQGFPIDVKKVRGKNKKVRQKNTSANLHPTLSNACERASDGERNSSPD